MGYYHQIVVGFKQNWLLPLATDLDGQNNTPEKGVFSSSFIEQHVINWPGLGLYTVSASPDWLNMGASASHLLDYSPLCFVHGFCRPVKGRSLTSQRDIIQLSRCIDEGWHERKADHDDHRGSTIGLTHRSGPQLVDWAAFLSIPVSLTRTIISNLPMRWPQSVLVLSKVHRRFVLLHPIAYLPRRRLVLPAYLVQLLVAR